MVYRPFLHLKETQMNEIIKYCKTYGIEITEYPGGTLRFTGAGVSLFCAGWKHVHLRDLKPTIPAGKRVAYDDAMARLGI